MGGKLKRKESLLGDGIHDVDVLDLIDAACDAINDWETSGIPLGGTAVALKDKLKPFTEEEPEGPYHTDSQFEIRDEKNQKAVIKLTSREVQIANLAHRAAHREERG